MEEVRGEERGQTAPSSSPPALSFPTLALDDEDLMVESEDSAREDTEDPQCHPRASAARTVFHQRRNDDDTLNSTRSLYDSDVVYFEIHGRRYCKDYFMPNDEKEQMRLQMLNDVYYTIFGERLTIVPLHNPKKILDIGTGTGEWAMAMGDEYPEAEVIGTDIAKIQPNAVPLNVFFEIDDAEEEGGWMWAEDEFDLVHIRYMCGAFADWTHIYKEAFTHLAPGGWIEVVDFDNFDDLMSFFEKDSIVPSWLSAVEQAAERSGRTRTVKHLEPEFLSSLGFVDVSCTDYDCPMGTWREDKNGRNFGKLFLVTVMMAYEALSLRLLTEQMGWSYEEIQRVGNAVVDVTKQKAISDPTISEGMGFRLKVLTGRKPGGSNFDVDMTEDGSSSRTMTMTDPDDKGVTGAAEL